MVSFISISNELVMIKHTSFNHTSVNIIFIFFIKIFCRTPPIIRGWIETTMHYCFALSHVYAARKETGLSLASTEFLESPTLSSKTSNVHRKAAEHWKFSTNRGAHNWSLQRTHSQNLHTPKENNQVHIIASELETQLGKKYSAKQSHISFKTYSIQKL